MIIPDTFLTVHEETVLFLSSVLLGMGMELVFDVFRALRVILPHKAAAAALEDVLFILIWASGIAAFTSALAKGDLRFFCIGGSVIGFILCRFLIGNPLVKLLSRLMQAVIRVIAWCTRPFRAVCVRIYRKFRLKFVRNAKNNSRRKEFLPAPLIAPFKMLYNIYNRKRKQGDNRRGSEKEPEKQQDI